MYAANRLRTVGDSKVVATLLSEKGPEVKEGWMPLHYAALHGDEAVVTVFLNGGGAHSRDMDGSPALAVTKIEAHAREEAANNNH